MQNMHVHIYINDVEYSDYVISYTREAKICTGIGNLTIDFIPELPIEIIPWDNITIEENGHTRVGSYYVASVAKRQPTGEIQIVAQDASKKLTDYFIAEQYYIDFASTSLYWMEFFLQQAGVTYEISSSDSALLSNNTQLGMTSTYDQIITLLQMNGWYMYFDAHDICHIGPLRSDHSSQDGEINTNEILSINILSHDKMLRNRILVAGAANLSSSGYITAEIIRHTPWNYDARDIRTAVIYNSNIATPEDAFDIATRAIDEFAQITVEKHITVIGSMGLYIGNIVRVRNDYFFGKGLVTTYGTSMSKDGLVTNLVLDERCPRLFAFFQPIDNVYVATYGDGVYVKKLTLDPNWYDVSYGIADLRVTDLHINKGVYSAVTAAGEAYYADNDPIISPPAGSGFMGTVLSSILWHQLSLDNIHPLFSGYPDVNYTYSGLKARATILNRETNIIKYAADTRPVENMGDYLMSTAYSGLVTSFSGMFFDLNNPQASGTIYDFQSCIVETNGRGYPGKVYPIKLSADQASGIYGITVTDDVAISGYRKGIGIYDIETQGLVDYVSIGINLSGLVFPYSGNFGYLTNLNELGSPLGMYKNDTAVISLNYVRDMNEATAVFEISKGTSPNRYLPIATFQDQTQGENDLICQNVDLIGSSQYRRIRVKQTVGGHTTTLDTSSQVAEVASTISRAICVKKVSDTNYIIYRQTVTNSTGLSNPITFRIVADDWNLTTTALTRTVLYTHTENPPSSPIAPGTALLDWSWGAYGLERNGILRILITETINQWDALFVDVDIKRLYYMEYDIFNNAMKVAPFLLFDTLNYPPNYEFIPSRLLAPYPIMFPYKDTIQILFVYFVFTNNAFSVSNFDARIFHYIPGVVANDFSAYAGAGTVAPGDFFTDSEAMGAELNNERALISASFKYGVGGEHLIDTTGFDTILHTTRSDKYFYEKAENIHSTAGLHDNKYIAHSGSNVAGDFYVVSDVNMAPLAQVSPPSNIELKQLLPMRDSNTNELLWSAYDNVSGSYVLVSSLIGAPNNIDNEIRYPGSGAFNGDLIKTGNFVYRTENLLDQIYYYEGGIITSGNGTIYLVLRRDNEDYTVLQSGLFPQRLEISFNNPLVTMARTIESTHVYDISISGVVTDLTNPGLGGVDITASGQLFGQGILAYDYRYADFNFGVGGLPPTEENPENTQAREIFIAYSGGIGITNVADLLVFSGLVLSETGIISKVESTNKVLPDQYMFAAKSGISNLGAVSSGVTVSGEWGFFQKDPSSIFVDYSSGYPLSRTTVIRIDDRI